MHDYLQKGRVVLAADTPNIDSDNDAAEIVFAGPVEIVRVGFIATTAVANAAGTVDIAVRRRPVAGADANQVELATFRLTTTTTRAAGSVCYKDLWVADNDGETAEDGTTRNEAPNSNITAPETGARAFTILPGQSLELKVVEPGDSGAGRAFVEYHELPFNGPWIDQATIFEDVTSQ